MPLNHNFTLAIAILALLALFSTSTLLGCFIGNMLNKAMGLDTAPALKSANADKPEDFQLSAF